MNQAVSQSRLGRLREGGPQNRRRVIGASGVGILAEDLRAAALAALSVSREACREYALQFGWQASVDQFLGHIAWL